MSLFQMTEPRPNTVCEIGLPLATATAPTRRATRSARLPKFVGSAEPAGTQLDGLNVMVTGCGSVGGSIATHLARLQPAGIVLVDPGDLKPESLLTHPVDPQSLGQRKVGYFGRLAKAISPKTRIVVFAGPIELLPSAAFAAVDLVVVATDDLAAEIEVGQRCIYHRIPLIQAAVHGETLVAQVRVWRNRDAAGACPACGMGTAEWEHLYRETRFSCAGSDAPVIRQPAPTPTRSVSALCSLAADLAMMQLLRIVLQLGPPVEDSVTELSAYQQRISISPLPRNTACPCDHRAWDRLSISGPLGRHSLRQLLELTPWRSSRLPPGLSYMVDQLEYIERVICCESSQTIGRFGELDTQVGHCPHCRRPLYPQRLFSHRVVSARTLGPQLDQPLDQLGAAASRAVVVRLGDRTVFCHEEIT
jgi:molybdopterin/thiamine biosynthesis adenylyltransferase